MNAIHDYIAEDNPDAADRVCDAIYTRIDVLRSAPRLAQRYECDFKAAVRQTVSGKYRIFFSIDDDQCRIEVLTIWHGARQEPEL
jgi:plasmid stabilization system protein ParE